MSESKEEEKLVTLTIMNKTAYDDVNFKLCNFLSASPYEKQYDEENPVFECILKSQEEKKIKIEKKMYGFFFHPLNTNWTASNPTIWGASIKDFIVSFRSITEEEAKELHIFSDYIVERFYD